MIALNPNLTSVDGRFGGMMISVMSLYKYLLCQYVCALSDAVYRYVSNDNPFNGEWKMAISMYGRDSRARFWSTLYLGCVVGVLRISALNIMINEVILGLHVLVIELNGLFTSDDR